MINHEAIFFQDTSRTRNNLASKEAGHNGRRRSEINCDEVLRSVLKENGRDDMIRTCDPLVPNQMRYQLRYIPTYGTKTKVHLYAEPEKSHQNFLMNS